MTRLMHCLLLLTACALFTSPAFGTVVCSVNSTGTAFGGYDTVGANPKDVVGTISVTCTGSIGDPVNYAIALSPGTGNFASRTMAAGASQLTYNLYSDGAHTAIWGDGTNGTATVSDSYTLSATTITRQYTVYGEIPGQSGPVAGSYLDTLVITVNY